MPCSSDGYPPTERDLWHLGAFLAACEMSKLLTPQQRTRLSPATLSWIAEHERYDREEQQKQQERTRREQKRRAAYDKLTPAERDALGVKKWNT